MDVDGEFFNHLMDVDGEFFNHLTEEEQAILLECALGGLRDELADGFLRENELLDLDLNDEVLTPIYDKLAKHLDAEDV